MRKEDLLVLNNGVKMAEDLELELFKKKVEELREYRQEVIWKIQKMRNEIFPSEILKIFRGMQSFYTPLGKLHNYDVGFALISDSKGDYGIIFSEHGSKSYDEYCMSESKDYRLHMDIEDSYAKKDKRYKLAEIKKILDRELEYWEFLQEHVEQVYSGIANQITKERARREEQNKELLNQLGNNKTEKKIKSITITITVEE